jgi:hypothetical protein
VIFRKCVDENRQMSILPLNILRGKMGCLEISEEHISVFKNLPNGTSTALHTQYKVNYAAASSFVYCWAPIVS